MSTEEIRAYVNAQMPDIDAEVARLVALGDRMSKGQVTAPELGRLLGEMEAVIAVLQNMYDRCLERFPDAEAGGRPDPYLSDLRDLVYGWHAVWEGWEAMGRAAIRAAEQ